MMKFILTWIIAFVIALILTAIIYIVYQRYQAYRAEHPSDDEIEKKRKDQEKFRQQYDAYEGVKKALIAMYGPITKDFYISLYEIDKAIFFFDNSKRVWFLGHNIPYECILSVTGGDKYSGTSETTYKTTTNTGNMAKRAIVGGAIGGVAGAVIGASTASTSTTSTSHQKYLGKKLEIILDDMNTPSITLWDDKFRTYYNVVGGNWYEEFDKLCSILRGIAIKNQTNSQNQPHRKVDDSEEFGLLKKKENEILKSIQSRSDEYKQVESQKIVYGDSNISDLTDLTDLTIDSHDSQSKIDSSANVDKNKNQKDVSNSSRPVQPPLNIDDDDFQVVDLTDCGTH